MIYDGGGGWVCACVWRGVFLQSTLVTQRWWYWKWPTDWAIISNIIGNDYPISIYDTLKMIAESGGHFWYHFHLWYWKWPPDLGRVVVVGGLEEMLREDISQIWIKRPQDGVCDMQEPMLPDLPCNLSQRPTVSINFISYFVRGVAFGIVCCCVEVKC